MGERTSVNVDQNFHQQSVFLEQVLLRSAIETSEFLVLTQDAGYDPNKPGVCFVAESADYTIQGDVVRICGPVACPGKTIKIVCRVLELCPDSQLRVAAIVVDGKKGDDGEPVAALPVNGVDGGRDDGDGDPGGPGQPGNDGRSPGGRGGTIELLCGTIDLQCDTTLSALGGVGGRGSEGTRGGHGGNGVLRHAYQSGGAGGDGGDGGPGGAGNAGGRGGAITLHYGSLRSDACTLSLTVRGGDGGGGGGGGDGGDGGDASRSYGVERPLHPGGFGGYDAPGGIGGPGGKGGAILIANAAADHVDLTIDCAHGGQGPEGKRGKEGSPGAMEQYNPDRLGGLLHQPRAATDGYEAGSRVNPLRARSCPPTPDADSATNGSVGTEPFRYDALRRDVSFAQLRMLVERLRFLFLRLGRADLSVDPLKQSPDLLELLAGIQWIEDLLADPEVEGPTKEEIRAQDHLDAVFRDSLDRTLYFFRGEHYSQYDAETRTLVDPQTRSIQADWNNLWHDGSFDAVTLGHCLQGYDEFSSPKYGGRAMFFRAGDVLICDTRNKSNLTVSGSLEVILGHACPALWNGIDLAFNLTEEGDQGLIFKGNQYYKYQLKSMTFSRIDGPYSIEESYPGLWYDRVTAAFSGERNKVVFFERDGSYGDDNSYRPPRYMIYDFGDRAIEPGFPKDIGDDWPKPGAQSDSSSVDGYLTEGDRSMAASLLQSARSLSKNLQFEKDYFGNTSTYVALATVEFLENAKSDALRDLEKAEAEYRRYQTEMNEHARSETALQLAVSIGSLRRRDIEAEAKDTLACAKAALAEINRLRDLLDAKGKALASDAGDLKNRVQSAWGVSWQDMFACLTQFSFTHWGNLTEKIESGPVLMAAGQAGDLMQKGISNVVTDSGQPMSKAYLVQHVSTLTNEIRSFKDLILTHGQFIDQTNLYNDSYKLMVTRDQFKELCGDFTRSFAAAQRIIDDLDDYVTLADQRNAAVMDYNQQWQHVYDLQAEALKAEQDCAQAQSGLVDHAQPGLPMFTSFATERYNRAKDQTLQIYYLASRAYILKSLKVRNLFMSMLSQLPATEQIDSATIRQGHLDSLYDQVIDELENPGPDGPCTARLVFEKAAHPEIFVPLAQDGLASFTIRKATSALTTRPFSGKANVRLTRVRCWAGGLAPGKTHYFRLVHTGRETFVTPNGEDVVVDHDPVVLDYEYQCDEVIDPTADNFVFKGAEKSMALTGKFALIGPFTTWNIVLDDEADRAAIGSLRIELEGMHQAFKVKVH